jgi:threonylcarbamoyladenosine tRNA methylthiotransferase MtaB
MLAMVERCGLTFLHVFPYSERPGTPAARMPQLPVPLRRERAARLRAVGQRAARRFYDSRVGLTEQVLLERNGRGHTPHFAPVRLADEAGQPGELRALRIVAAGDDGLIGKAA